jgi:signal transduction histidine kinase
MTTKPEPQTGAAAAMTVEVAHELRERLTVLLFSLEQLQRQALTDHGQDLLNRAKRAAGQISETVNRVRPI